MEYHQVKGRVKPGGILQIHLPDEWVGQEIDGIIVFDAVASGKAGYDFRSFKNSIDWPMNPVDYQRKLRDEWT